MHDILHLSTAGRFLRVTLLLNGLILLAAGLALNPAWFWRDSGLLVLGLLSLLGLAFARNQRTVNLNRPGHPGERCGD